MNTTHPMSDFKIVVGNVVAYYNYMAGNSLQINHLYVDGKKIATLPREGFLKVCEAAHDLHMVQGADTDCDESDDNEDA